MKKLALLFALLCPMAMFAQNLESGTITVRKVVVDQTLPTLVDPSKRDSAQATQNISARDRKLLAPGLYASSNTRLDSARGWLGGRKLKSSREYLFISGDGLASYFRSSKSPRRVYRRLERRSSYEGLTEGTWKYSDEKEVNLVDFDVTNGSFNGTLSFSGIYNKDVFSTARYTDITGMPQISDQTFNRVGRKGQIGI